MLPERRAIGVDIGATTTKIAAVTPDGAITGLTTLPTLGPALAFTAGLQAAICPLLDQPVVGVGVSVAGFVDDARSAMIYNPNLAWLEGFPLCSELERRLAQTVVLDADSNAACVAEYLLGSGRGARRFFCLSLGTGVGGGMIVDGEVVRLAYGGLGDIGHVLVEPFGPPCGAGCRGCAEATISAPAIERRWPGDPRLTTREIVEAAHRGEPAAVSLLAETGRLLAIAIASQAVILFPDVIAVAGGVSEAGELLLAPARASLQALTGSFYRNGLRLEKAALGWQAALVGAALPLLQPVS